MVRDVLIYKTYYNGEVDLPLGNQDLFERIVFRVYVLNFNGKPSIPINDVKIRILLKKQKAIFKNVNLFTIQLTYKIETEYIQPITLAGTLGLVKGTTKIKKSVVLVKKI